MTAVEAVRIIRRTALLGLLASAPAVHAAGLATFEELHPAEWQGAQIIQADGDGQVFLLVSNLMKVFRVNDQRALEPALELRLEGPDSPGWTRMAAMGERGEWLVQQGNRVVFFGRDGRGSILPATREPVFAVAMAGDDPVVMVLSSRAGGWAVMRWDGDEWSDWVRVDGEGQLDVTLAMERADSFLDISPNGKLWLARRYSERVLQYSPAGRELLDLSAAEGMVAHAPASPETEKRLAKYTERIPQNAQVQARKAGARAFTAKPIYHAAAVDSFEQAFFLKLPAVPDRGFLLQRWNRVEQRLEEVEVDLPGPSLYTMAFGGAGLHLAPFKAAGGRFFIPAEALENAAWAPVQDVSINGFVESAADP